MKLEYLTSRDDTLRYRFAPGERLNSGGQLSSLGLRNREITEKRDQIRVLFLGDSLIWSGETSSGELYTQVIERSLNQNVGKGSREVEVINAGIPGYTTYQESEFLKIYGLDMKPDLVILGVVFNDLYYKYLHKPQKGKILGIEPSIHLNRFDVDTFPGSLFARSYLAHEAVYAKDQVVRKLTKGPFFPFDHKDDFYLAWKEYAWKKERELVREMNDLLKERGIQFVIMAFPVRDQVDDQYLNLNRDYVLFPQRKLREVCSDYGIPFWDLTETIYESGGAVLFKNDGIHLNQSGNDVIARELTVYLSSRSYVTGQTQEALETGK